MSTAPKQHKSMGAFFIFYVVHFFFLLKLCLAFFVVVFVIYNTIKS